MKIAAFLILAVLVVAPSAGAENANLTGLWKDDNGSVYAIRQAGDKVFWYVDAHPDFINVYKGTVHDKTIFGEWADLPGGKRQDSGTLDVRIESDSKLLKISSSGDFGASVWHKIDAAPTAAQPAAPKAAEAASARAWAGVWTQDNYVITATLDGDQLTYKSQSPAGSVSNPTSGLCKATGDEAICEWKSDPEYRDGVKSGVRTGTGKIKFVAGASPADDRVTGEWLEGENDFYKEHPSTSMKPGAKWPANWTRKKEAKPAETKP